MKKLAALAGCLTLALVGCEDSDPVGSVPDSQLDLAYAEAIRNVQPVPWTVVHPAPGRGGDGISSAIPLAAAEVAAGRTQIVNGSFETGDFAGWTTVTTGNPFRPWAVTGAGQGGGFGMAGTEPQDGAYVAWNGFDGQGPMVFEAYQDVKIGGGVPTLTFMDRAQWNFTLGAFATLPRTAQLEVRDPGTDDVLDTPYSFSTGTQAEAPTGDTGWQEHTIDLSAFRGQTVRLAFKQWIPQSATGPAQYELDGVTSDGMGNGGAKLLQSALVLNPGESTPTGNCTFAGRLASQATFVRNPRGGGTLSCRWDEFAFNDVLEDALVIKGSNCFLNFGGINTTTTSSHFVLTPEKTAKFTCQFENLV